MANGTAPRVQSRVIRQQPQPDAKPGHTVLPAALALGGGAAAWWFFFRGKTAGSSVTLPAVLPCPSGWTQVSDPGSPVGFYCTPANFGPPWTLLNPPPEVGLQSDEALEQARLILDTVLNVGFGYNHVTQVTYQIGKIGLARTLDYVQAVAAELGVGGLISHH